MSEHKATPKPQEAKKVTSELGSNETATSFEGASYDFGPGVMAFKSLQAAADDSPRSNSITQFQAMADATSIMIQTGSFSCKPWQTLGRLL